MNTETVCTMVASDAGQFCEHTDYPKDDLPPVAKSQLDDNSPVMQAAQEVTAGGRNAEAQSSVSPSPSFDNLDAGNRGERNGAPIKCAPKRAAKKPMMNRLRKGKTVLVIQSYAELKRVAKAFGDRHFKLVILIGNPGLGKTRLFKELTSDGALHLHGRVTPLQFYIEAYRHRNQPIIIDDVGGLIREPLGIDVLKDLCQTEPEKTVAWRTSSRLLVDEKIPPKFPTTSPVIIITNTWSIFDEKLPALEDRGQVFVFDPRPLDIHLAAAEWFDDQEVFDFIGKYLHFIPSLSMRTYRHAVENKAAGFDWHGMIVDTRRIHAMQLVIDLKADASFKSEEERVRSFIEKKGGKRATYYRYAKKLKHLAEVPKITLARSRNSEKEQTVA